MFVSNLLRPWTLKSTALRKENDFTLKRQETKTMTDTEDQAVFSNTTAQSEFLLHLLEQAAVEIDLNVNAYKTLHVF